jgi:Fe-S oxidoreductase
MGPGEQEPFREYMPSIPSWVEPVMYVAFVVMVGLVAWDATMRLRRYGISWPRFLLELGRSLVRRPGAVAVAVGQDVLGQRRVRRDRTAGLIHLLIFGSFLLLTVGTGLIALERDITERLGFHFLRGNVYLAYEVLLDTAGLVLIAGIVAAAVRRYRRPPAHLGPRPTILVVYAILLFAAVSGFVLEGLRIILHPVSWSGISFVGSFMASVMAPVVGERPLELYWGVWGAHLVGAFAGMAVILRTALDHAIVLPLNTVLAAGRDRERPLPFNLATADENDLGEVRAGVGRLEELDWDLRFRLDACVRCGRCDRACPAVAAGRALSPQGLVQGLVAELRTSNGSRGNLFALDVVDETAVWSCLACGACAVECPALIDHPGTILDLRRHLVGEGQVSEAQATLVASIERNGNPFGLPSYQRGDWLAALGVPSFREEPDAEYLYWIGCMAAYDPAARQVAEAVIQVLRHAGIRFAVLGEEERCTGESARRMGDEAGFQVRAIENIALLQEVGVRRILTHCPHCLTILGKEYAAFGGSFEVVHHTELFARLIREGRIPAASEAVGAGVTYHDPCNLGRLGGSYDAPREVARFGAGRELAEPAQSRERGFCCGAGGGSSWWTVPETTKVSHLRLEQLQATGAGTVLTACPHCLVMLGDASRVGGNGIEVIDVAQLVTRGLPAGTVEPDTAIAAP